MFYRSKIDLAFPEQKEALKAIEKAVDVLSFAITLNPGMPSEERGFIIVEKCYHDEDPTKPCEIIKSYQTPSP